MQDTSFPISHKLETSLKILIFKKKIKKKSHKSSRFYCLQFMGPTQIHKDQENSCMTSRLRPGKAELYS